MGIDLTGVRTLSLSEIKAKNEKRATEKARVRNRDPGVVVRKRQRPKFKQRYSVSLTPKFVLFLRLQYGGESGNLSEAIDKAARILYHLQAQSLLDEPLLGIKRLPKKVKRAMGDANG